MEFRPDVLGPRLYVYVGVCLSAYGTELLSTYELYFFRSTKRHDKGENNAKQLINNDEEQKNNFELIIRKEKNGVVSGNEPSQAKCTFGTCADNEDPAT